MPFAPLHQSSSWGSPEVVSSLLVAAFTLLLAVAALVVAIFSDQLRSWRHRPRLVLTTQLTPPEVHKTYLKGTTRKGPTTVAAYYFLVRVENSGNHFASEVTAVLASVARRTQDGGWALVESLPPQRLRWSWTGTAALDNLPAGLSSHCTLCHIVNPASRSGMTGEDPNLLNEWGPPVVDPCKTALCLDVEFKSADYTYVLPPGEYRLELLVGCAEVRPARVKLLLVLGGGWSDTLSEMLREGISLQTLPT